MNEQFAVTINPSTTSAIEFIPSDDNVAESCLKHAIEHGGVTEIHQAINVGIADAEEGKLTSLTTVKAKWLSR